MFYALIEIAPDRDPVGYFPYTTFATREDADQTLTAPMERGTTRELYIVASGKWSMLTRRTA